MRISRSTHACKLLLSGVALLLSLCAPSIEIRNVQVLDNSTSLFMEARETATISITWFFPGNEDSTKYHELFFRTAHDTAWNLLKSNIPPATNPLVVIHRNELPLNDSIFYFSVRSTGISDTKSDFHYSSDNTASPQGGWFLHWK